MVPATNSADAARPEAVLRRTADLQVAPPQSDIARPALVRTLMAARTARIVLLAAPGGFGKSTLVARWQADPAESRPFAWIGLDEGHDDPVSLWTAILLALNSVAADGMGDDLVRLLRLRGTDIEDLLLPHLLARLGTLRAPVVLVLEDCHAIKDPACHRQLEALIAKLPGTVQLVLITRADPPLPLARYRASGEMLELGMGRLRFSRAEAGRLIHQVTGIDLPEADLGALVEHTEGWPAAVSLAARSMRERADPASAMRAVTGTHRYIADYLAEEVLGPLPEGLRELLVRTSILDEFTAPLWGAVAGTAAGEAIIGELDRANLFLIPMDDNRHWYRYHRLFGEALRDMLARSDPGLIPQLHRRASVWYEREGMADEAIAHALDAGDVHRAVDVVSRHWFGRVVAGRAATVRGWLAAIGTSRVHSDPVAAICAAWTAAASGDRQGVRYWLAEVERMPDGGALPDGITSLRSAVALIRGTFGYDGVAPMVEAARTAAELEREPVSEWYAMARLGLGFSRYLAGDAAAAVRPLEEAVQAEGARTAIRLVSMAILALVVAELGRTEQAAELARTARDMLAGQGLADQAEVGLVYTANGMALAGMRLYLEAADELESALRLCRGLPGMAPWPATLCLTALAEIALGRGERDRASALLDEAAALLDGVPGDGGLLRTRLDALRRRLAGAARATPAEPLSDREEAVLRLLRGRLSLREIGAQLYVSVNTVKSHTRAIYRKLDVASRDEAIKRARELGLL
jgi:LuxR family maltose regulon positive regulatory protein